MDEKRKSELSEIQSTYVPFLKKLLSFLKNKASQGQISKVQSIYDIFTGASSEEQLETFHRNKNRLEQWYKSSLNNAKDKSNENSPSQSSKRILESDDTDSSQGVPETSNKKTKLENEPKLLGSTDANIKVGSILTNQSASSAPRPTMAVQATVSKSAAAQNPTINIPPQNNNSTTNSSPVLFACASCQYCTHEEADFIKHTRTDHRSDLSMWCKDCGKCFSNAGILVTHIKEKACVKEEMIYRCGVKDCTFETGSGQTFVHHLRHCHKGSPFIFCVHCQKIFTLPHCLILHMQDDCPFKSKNRKSSGDGSQVPAAVQPAPNAPAVAVAVVTPLRTAPIIPVISPVVNKVVPPLVVATPSPTRGRGYLLPTRGGRGKGRGRGRGRGRAKETDSSDSDDPDDPSWRPEETAAQVPLRRSGRWAKKVNDCENAESTTSKSLSLAELNSKSMLNCPCCDSMAAFKSVLEDHYIAQHKVSNKNACTVCLLKFESTQGFIDHFEDHANGKLRNTPLQVSTDIVGKKQTSSPSNTVNINGSKNVQCSIEKKDSAEEVTANKLFDAEYYKGVVKHITEADKSKYISAKSNFIKIPYQIEGREKTKKSAKFQLFEDLKAPGDLQSMKEADHLKNLFKCSFYSCKFTSHNDKDFSDHLSTLHKGKQGYCSYCMICLNADETLSNHIISEHSQRSYQCSRCFYRAYSKMHVKFHIDDSHSKDSDVEIYTCESVSIPKEVKTACFTASNLTTTWPYVCAVGDCAFQCYDPQEFLQHNGENHRNVSIFYCHYCKVDFISFKRLFHHYRLHGINTFQCQYCVHGSESKSDILLHVCNLHADLPLEVLVRGSEEDSTSNNTLQSGSKEANDVNNTAVDKASNVQPENRIDFESQLYEVVGETYYPRFLQKICSDFICGVPHCRDKLDSVTSYVGHLVNVHSTLNFPCPHCTLMLETWLDFTNHMLSHGPNLYACGMVTCEFYNPDKNDVMEHLKTHKNNSAKVVIIREEDSSKCDINQIKSLPIQSPVQTDVKDGFVCFFCKFKCSSKKVMKNHLYHEMAYKRYLCKSCNVKLVSRDAVQQHYETLHSGEKENFTLHPKPNIENYVQQLLEKKCTHPDSEPIKCTICAKNFKSVEQFQGHVMLCVQNLYQPYDCYYCKKSFSNLRIVKYHMDEKHLSEDFKFCEVCSYQVEDEIDESLQRIRLDQVAGVLDSNVPANTSQSYLSKFYKCSICSFKADYKFVVGDHIKTSSSCHLSEIIKNEFQLDLSEKVEEKEEEIKVKETKNKNNDIKQYICGYCNKKMHDRQEVEDHVDTIHHIENKYCYYYTPDPKQDLLENDKEKYECAYCKSGKETLLQLKNHSELMHSEMEFKVKGYIIHSRDSISACGYCYFRANNAELKKHIANDHTGMPNKIIQGFSELTLKRSREDSDDPPNKRVKFSGNVFVCGHCGAAFSSHDLITSHTGKAHSRLPVDIKKLCPSVDKDYNEVTFYKCEFCQFTSEAQFLEPHLAAKHKHIVTCQYCQKRFEFATKAKEHHEVSHKGMPVNYSQETVGSSVIPKRTDDKFNNGSKITVVVPSKKNKQVKNVPLETFSKLHNIYPVVSLQKCPF